MQSAWWSIKKSWKFHDQIGEDDNFGKNFKIWASDDIPLKRYWRVRQDLCECAMDKRHGPVLLAIRLLARERVQNHTSKQGWMCNEYTACDSIVGTMGTGPWVIAAPSVKSSVNVKWIYGMSPYCWQDGPCPEREYTTSVKTTVNVQWI